jgi:hypothetical protein
MYYVQLYKEVCKTTNAGSKVAVVELVQLMDHRDISNAVESTCLLRVAGRATSDVLSSFWVWYVKRARRISATKIFHLSYSHI